MKLTKKLEAEIKKFMKTYWDTYLKGDLKTWATFLPADYKNIGGTEEEIWNSRKEILDYTKRISKQMVGQAEVRNTKTEIIPYDPYMMVHEFMDMFIKVDKKWTFYGKFRLSSIIQKTAGGWKVLHQHGCYPDSKTTEGEAFAFDTLKSENLKLQKAVKDRTAELEQKKRELEIETSLEKVRAIAMGMKDPEDMLDVCKTISLQLQSLGVKEIRNVQTAIFYQDPGTYMNYEYYAKHKKSIITETSYTNHKMHKAFAKKMMQGKGEFFVTHIKHEKVKEWIAYQKSTNVFIDKYLEKASSVNYYWHSLGPVALGISTYAPLSKSDQELFNRFLKVFELAYTRYLDIEQALVQVRESEIQLALERIRACTMAMHKSGELAETVHLLFQQFKELGENPDQATIGIINEKDWVIEYWVTMHGNQTNKVFRFTIDEPNVTKKIYEAWKEGKKSLVIDLAGKALSDFMKYRSSMGGAAARPDEKRRIINVAFFSSGLLNVQSLESRSAESIVLLERFAKVFEQTYTRFLDLQKAEAQAKEAQIEAALERVRSRSMGMQKSEEFKEVIKIVYQQLRLLNINLDHAGFVVDYIPGGDWHFWIADEQDIPSKISHPWFESVWANQFNKAKENGANFFATHLSFEEKNKFYNELLSYVPGLPEASKDFYLSCPGLAGSTVLFDNVSLYMENFSGIPYSEGENKILLRFGKVFQQTYTRFLDLQKAEAQAREAKIEAALERTRTQSMLMQHSEQLDDTLRVFHEQVLLLNIPSAFSFLWLPDEKNDRHIFWAVWEENNSFKSKAINYPLDRHEPATAQCLVDWKGKDPVVSYHVPPADVDNYFAAWHELLDGVEKLKPEYFRNGLFYVEAFIKYGCFGVMVESELAADEKKILLRFATEFERTYTRFLDLQKAEAQAREAQIETALEKVRSRTLAMQKSDELAETATVLFQQLIALGIEPNRLYIILIKEDSADMEAWVTDEDGSKVSIGFTSNYRKNASLLKMYEGWKEKRNSLVIDMQGEELKQYFHYLHNELHVPFKGGLEQKRRVQHIAYFSHGLIGIASPDEQPAETIQLLERFAAVFNLTFTRFNDLKIAEAHAQQAEQDLVAIKEAKQKAEDTLAELQVTQKQLIQSEKMASLGELTAGIAHEIQNPLNFVNNFSEVSNELIDEMNAEIAKGDFEEAKLIANDIKQNLEKINHHGKRADAIVKGMLQHSRSSSATKEPTDINKLADEYLRLAFHGLRAKDKSFNATLITDYDEALEKVNVTPQDIGRVILNLITNAFYVITEKKRSGIENYEPTVSVSTRRIGDMVEISVKDNGNGISEKVLDKIFQPFFTTKPTGQGTGLGLSLSYDIIKAHGGELKVETKEGDRSTFIIQLPTN